MVQGSIEGRRDLAGGRLSSDRRALGNSTSGQCFSSLAFSADGAFLLAGGSTKFVCMYDVEEQVMLRRFQASLLCMLCLPHIARDLDQLLLPTCTLPSSSCSTCYALHAVSCRPC